MVTKVEKNKIINGFAEGYWEHYYSDGRIRCRGNYRNGMPVGYWEFYKGYNEIYNIFYFYI